MIARHEVAMAWKGWWRYKAPLAIAVIATFVAGGLMYALSDRVLRTFGGHFVVTVSDGVVPMSIRYYQYGAFLVSLTIGGATIAGDVESGALPFYFARSTRPIDYLAGKLAGYGVVVATVAAAGPLALALFRLGMSSSAHALVQHLATVPEALGVGALATLVFAAVPLGFSALIPNRRYALAAWAAYYLIAGSIALSLAASTHAWIGAIDLPIALATVAAHLFGSSILPTSAVPLSAALVSIAVQCSAALALAGWRIAKLRAAGVGGGA